MEELDQSKLYSMPLIMGPVLDKDEKMPYPEVEIVAFQYLTEPDAVNLLLPNSFQVAKEPLVTVLFGYNNGLRFMAGGEYRLAAIQVAAHFNGNQDNIEGDYNLVMFEDQTWPIIGGREFLGVPKLHADISSIKILSNNHLQCEASLWGHLLFGVVLERVKKQNSIVRMVASKQINSRPWLGYKYVDSIDGPPDANYPTITRNDTKIKEISLGNSGSIYFGESIGEQNIHMKRLMDALQTLPVLKVKQTMRLRGSATLRFDLSRRLK